MDHKNLTWEALKGFSKQEMRKSAIQKRNLLKSQEAEFFKTQALLNAKLLELLRLMSSAPATLGDTQIAKTITIASYLPFGSEFDLNLNASCLVNTSWYYPKTVMTNGSANLRWFNYQNAKPHLQKNQWGILEAPAEYCQDCFATPKNKWIVIVPALMIDKNGFRLGYGKGFYDRFIIENSSSLVTITCLPEIFRVEKVPTDNWDQPINYCVTETKIIKHY